MQIVIGIVSMIPYAFAMISMVTSMENQLKTGTGIQPEDFSFFMIMMGLVVLASMLLNFILQNLLLINQGIMYYSLGAKEKISNRDIDLIGTDNE